MGAAAASNLPPPRNGLSEPPSNSEAGKKMALDASPVDEALDASLADEESPQVSEMEKRRLAQPPLRVPEDGAVVQDVGS